MQTSKITRIAVIALVLLFLVLSVISCTTTHVHNHDHHHHGKKMPPGQAKKMHGDKSAKAYAPGQQKKR